MSHITVGLGRGVEGFLFNGFNFRARHHTKSFNIGTFDFIHDLNDRAIGHRLIRPEIDRNLRIIGLALQKLRF